MRRKGVPQRDVAGAFRIQNERQRPLDGGRLDRCDALPLRETPGKVTEFLRVVRVAIGHVEDGGNRLVRNALSRLGTPLSNEQRKVAASDGMQDDGLRHFVEGMVTLGKDRFHEVPLAAEEDVGNLSLHLEDSAHQAGKVLIDLDNLLELVKDHGHTLMALASDLARQAEQLLNRAVEITRALRRRELE